MEVKNEHWDLLYTLFCMYCSFEISPPLWLFPCIDRWVIGDLITWAYVPSAGEYIDRRQAGGTLSLVKSCWLFTSSSNYAQIIRSYCTLKKPKEVGGGTYCIKHQYLFWIYFIFTYLLLFSLCGLEFYTTKTILYPFVFIFYIFILRLWGEKPVIWLFGSKEVTVHGV